jgi:hypothetical protein
MDEDMTRNCQKVKRGDLRWHSDDFETDRPVKQMRETALAAFCPVFLLDGY